MTRCAATLLPCWWRRGSGLRVVAASSAGELQRDGRGCPDPFGSGRASAPGRPLVHASGRLRGGGGGCPLTSVMLRMPPRTLSLLPSSRSRVGDLRETAELIR